MKKNLLTTFILLLMLMAFVLLALRKEELKSYKILKVVEADTFYIDINENGKIDEDELFRLKNVIAFSPTKNFKTKEYAKNLEISEAEYLKLGYLAQAWAKDELTYKDVIILSKIKPLQDKEKYRFVTLKYNKEDLAEKLLAQGLAFVYKESDNSFYFQVQNIKQIKNNIKEISKLDFVFVNLKSNIAHLLTCEHFDKILNGTLILKKNIDYLKTKQCKVCFIKTKDENEIEFIFPKSVGKYPKSINKTFKNIELYLINPLEYNKPSKTSRTNISKKIISEINNAKKSIDLAIYGINEQMDIANALQNAKKRGVKVRVVMDKSANMKDIYPYSLTFEKEFMAKTDSIKTLMHNKFIIFDNQKVMTGSLNLSSSGSGGYNANVVAFINSSEISNYYKQEFEQMYNGHFSNQKEKIETNQNSNIVPYFSPKGEVYKDGILPLIKNAKSKIYISAFYLTDRNLIDELIKAKKRNIEVLIILDSLSANNFKERVLMLRNAKIPLKVENWGGKNHEKTIMIDDEVLVIGSCNFSKSGFEKNDENILVIKNKEIAKFYADYFLYLFNEIDNKFLKAIPRAESLDSRNSCYDGIDNNFDGKIDFEDEGCKSKK